MSECANTPRQSRERTNWTPKERTGERYSSCSAIEIGHGLFQALLGHEHAHGESYSRDELRALADLHWQMAQALYSRLEDVPSGELR